MKEHLDPTTFGSFKCAKILVKLLEEKPEFKKKVCGLISSYMSGIAYIEMIPNKSYRKAIALLWRNDYYSRIRFDEKINTYTKCVMSAYFRELVKKGEGCQGGFVDDSSAFPLLSRE